VLAVAINFPDLVHEFAEEFATLDFRAPDLDKLREAILKTAASSEDHLEGEKLRLHLCEAGFQRIVDSLNSPQVYNHAGFARPAADIEKAREGWLDLMRWFRETPGLQAQLAEEERDFAENMTDENWARYQALLIQKTLAGQREEEDGAAGERLP
jgi:DNA primase